MKLAVALLLVGCTSERVVRPLTIVHVDVTNPDCPDGCWSPLGFYDVCSGHFPLIEPSATHIDADTAVDADELAQLVQLQYAGAIRENGQARPHLDFTLTDDVFADVAAAFEPDTVLYRIDARGAVVDINANYLAGGGNTLEFHYGNVVENHLVAQPRLVEVDVGESYFCCAAGSSSSLAPLAALLLVVKRRRFAAPSAVARTDRRRAASSWPPAPSSRLAA